MTAIKHPRIPVFGIIDQVPVFSGKLLIRKNGLKIKFDLFKRLSPFLLMVPLLLFLFPYMFITGVGTIHTKWILAVIFPIVILNILFFDFAIWNWFAGKKRGIIWALELVGSFILLYLLV